MINKNQIKRIARERHELHKRHSSSRPLSTDYELVGLMGEVAFAVFSGVSPDLSLRPEGDSGIFEERVQAAREATGRLLSAWRRNRLCEPAWASRAGPGASRRQGIDPGGDQR